ncbi:3349_t:CDS:2, partial [Racocetra fulgida]
TEEFQRLRDIKQLGASNYVFPSACHNRFEHSLGTAHLAYTLTKKLQDQPGIETSDRDLKCVTLAALCHDLGHGPFSHVFDNEVIPAIAPKLKWKHEDGSELMLDHLYNGMESRSIDLSTDDLKYIKNLIKGDRTGSIPLSKDDIIVDWQDLNYAKGKSNPIESVKFYNKDRTMILDLEPERISHLFPEQYQERIVRIFSRDPNKVDSIHDAFKKLARKLDLNVNEGFITGEKVDIMDFKPKVDSQYNKNEDSIKKTLPISDG